jgi:anti-sigma factor RsiW
LDKRKLTCDEMEGLFETFLDGAPGADEEVLRAHLATCAACRTKYALDLALIECIHTAPDVAFESVAAGVADRVKVWGRSRWALRWGMAVAAIGFYEVVFSLLTGRFKRSPAFLALNKVAGLAKEFAAALKTMIVSGTMPGGLGSYAHEALLATLLTGGLVIFMMYAMGRWLRKPMEVNS